MCSVRIQLWSLWSSSPSVQTIENLLRPVRPRQARAVGKIKVGCHIVEAERDRGLLPVGPWHWADTSERFGT